MRLVDIRRYLADIIPGEGAWFGIARMNTARDRAFCLYHKAKQGLNNIAVGGAEATGYRRMPLSLLIRWAEDAVEAEEKAIEVYNIINERKFEIDGITGFMQPVYAAPVALGTDNRGVFEFSMEFEVVYSF